MNNRYRLLLVGLLVTTSVRCGDTNASLDRDSKVASLSEAGIEDLCDEIGRTTGDGEWQVRAICLFQSEPQSGFSDPSVCEDLLAACAERPFSKVEFQCAKQSAVRLCNSTVGEVLACRQAVSAVYEKNLSSLTCAKYAKADYGIQSILAKALMLPECATVAPECDIRQPILVGHRLACDPMAKACTAICPCDNGDVCDPTLPIDLCDVSLECTSGKGDRFGRSANTPVCWDPDCDDQRNAGFECGDKKSRCGLCPECTTNCVDKSCGYDGCWGTCGDYCEIGQAGCESDGDCVASICGGYGPDFGKADGLHVCVPDECRSLTRTNPCQAGNVGETTACGVCRASQ